MKILKLMLVPILLIFISCEEVVDVDLNTAAPRLVIDASLRWEKGTPGSFQMIRLSTTTGYFENQVPSVSGASVTVSDSQGNTFTFLEEGNSGEYYCEDFVPVLNENYTLTVVVDGQTYIASETLLATPEIDYITQAEDGGFTGDEREVKVFFTDNAQSDDFYLFTFISPVEQRPVYNVQEDRLIQGNQSFETYSDDDLEPGDVVTLSLGNISERYFNYLRILLSISGGAGGNPFQSPPATVRGNIVNTTDSANYALGYFSVIEVDLESVEIE